MSTNTKKNNALTTIIIAVVIIFIASVVWNKSKTDNAEEITIIKLDTTPIKKKQRTKVTPVAEIEQTYTDEITPEELAKASKEAMSWSMVYNTPERVEAGIKSFEKAGNIEKADKLRGYMKLFPDYDFPDNL